MAAALPVDWRPIIAAYCQGIPKRELATRFNVNYETLRKRATREDWDMIQAQSARTVTNVIVKVGPKDEKPQSIKLRDSLATELERDLEAVSKSKPLSLTAASKRQQVISSIVSNAKVIHGWGEQQQSTLISLGMLSGQEAPVIAVGQAAGPGPGLGPSHLHHPASTPGLASQSPQPMLDVDTTTTPIDAQDNPVVDGPAHDE